MSACMFSSFRTAVSKDITVDQNPLWAKYSWELLRIVGSIMLGASERGGMGVPANQPGQRCTGGSAPLLIFHMSLVSGARHNPPVGVSG